MRDIDQQPEWAGAQSESDLNRAQYGDPGYPAIGRIVPPQAYPVQVTGDPAPDPSAEAIQATLAAERRADAGKVVPADATVIPS